MRTIICTLLLLNVSFTNSQNFKLDFYNFYKGGNESKKPIKYVLFDVKEGNHNGREHKNVIYFNIKTERFVFNKEKHKIDTCSITLLKKVKLESAEKLQEEETNYFIKRVEEYEKRTNRKVPKSMPLSRTHKYLKVYILEKIDTDKVIRHEVDWEYSMF